MVCSSRSPKEASQTSENIVSLIKYCLYTADQAHALYNGVAFEDGSRLHLYFTNGRQEPEPSAIVLQVKNLAADVTSSEVYSLFRVFGPLGFCTIVSDEPNVEIRGSALVQFYEQEDADIAESEMVRTLTIHIR